MSIHPSLRASEKDKKARTVLRRTERLKTMLEKNQWKIGDDVYGLPKIKTLRIKIKKEKAEKTAETTAAAGEATATAPQGAPAAKEVIKGAGTAKTQEKK